MHDTMTPAARIAPQPMLYVFSFAHLLHDLFTGIWLLVLTVQVDQLELSYRQQGAASAAYTLVAAIAQPPLGAFFDRSGKPYLAVWSVAFTSVMVTCAGLAPGYGLLLLAAGGAGLGSAAFHAAGLSSARQLAVGRGSGRATAIFLLGGNGGFAIGAYIGGVILDHYGTTMLTLPALLLVVATPLLVHVLQPYLQGLANEPTRTTREFMRGGSKALLPVFAYIVLILATQAIYGGFATYLPKFYQARDISLETAGVFTSVFLLFAAVGSLIGGTLSDYMPRRRVAMLSMIVSAPLSYVMLRTDGFTLGILSVFLGLATNISLPILLIIGQEVLPGGRSAASGYAFGITFLTRAISTPLIGDLADRTDLLNALTVVGMLPLLVTLLVLLLPATAAPADTGHGH